MDLEMDSEMEFFLHTLQPCCFSQETSRLRQSARGDHVNQHVHTLEDLAEIQTSCITHWTSHRLLHDAMRLRKKEHAEPGLCVTRPSPETHDLNQ